MVLAVEYELKPFSSDLFLIITVIALTLLAGLRGPQVSKDYEAYQNVFDYIHYLSSGNNGIVLSAIEPGFAAIVLLFRSIFKVNYVLPLMLFFAFSSVTLKIISIKKLSVNPYLVILFYYSHYFLLHEMTQIRIGFASAFIFIALIFYLKGNKLITLFLILFATLFHYSAILYLLILLLDSKRFYKPVYLGILAASLVFGFLRIPLLNYFGNFNAAGFSGKLANYAYLAESGKAEEINVFNVIYILNLLMCLYFIIFIPLKVLTENKSLLLFLKCNIISIFLLSFLSGVPSVAFRFSELFGLVSMFLYASLVSYLPFEKKLNLLITILVAAVIFYINVFHSEILKPYYISNIR
jgi:hypothetical protein